MDSALSILFSMSLEGCLRAAAETRGIPPVVPCDVKEYRVLFLCYLAEEILCYSLSFSGYVLYVCNLGMWVCGYVGMWVCSLSTQACSLGMWGVPLVRMDLDWERRYVAWICRYVAWVRGYVAWVCRYTAWIRKNVALDVGSLNR